MFSFIDKYYTKKCSKFYPRYSLFINFKTYSIIGFVSFLFKVCFGNIQYKESLFTFNLQFSVQSMHLHFYVT